MKDNNEEKEKQKDETKESNNKDLSEKKEEKIDEIYKNGKEKKITCFKLVMNTFVSLVLFVLLIYIPKTYKKKWKIFFFMTLWSYFMNSYYIISVTIIDWICFIKKNSQVCSCYNNFVRNLYLRICFPFAVSIVFLYWMLILLGDDFEYRGRDLSDTAIGIFFHGIILIFLLFDMFTARHINKKNYYWDVLILTILVCIYYVILGIGKYSLDYNPYDFMEMSNIRQIIGACILIYIAIMDAYVLLNILANRFFEQEDEITTIKDDKNETKITDENNINNISNIVDLKEKEIIKK